MTVNDRMIVSRRALLASIGASVLVYRVFVMIFHYLFDILATVPISVLKRIGSFESFTSTILAVIIALFASHKLYALFLGRPIHFLALCMFWVCALLPIQFKQLSYVPIGDHISTPDVTDNHPDQITIMCQVIDEDKIHSYPVLNNSHIISSEPYLLLNRNYSIKLKLTKEGQSLIRKATTDSIGSDLAFSLDSHLKCVEEIKQPIHSDFIIMPTNMSFDEASRLASAIVRVESEDSNAWIREDSSVASEFNEKKQESETGAD